MMKNFKTILATAVYVGILFVSINTTGQDLRRLTAKESTDKAAVAGMTDGNSLAGSWYVIVTVPAEGGDRTFRGLITFSEGGGMIASAQGDILLDFQSPATAGHGSWVRTGNREFLFTFVQIIYTGDGSYDGGLKVRHTATMDKSGNMWSGNMTAEFFNSNDEVVGTGTGTATATRIVPAPLLP